MDVGDMVGDKAAGVRTVAVCFGRRFGTVAAGMALAAANAVLVSFHFLISVTKQSGDGKSDTETCCVICGGWSSF